MSTKHKHHPKKKPSSSKPAKALKRRGPGRPPKPDELRMLVVGTRVSPRVFKLLKKKADSESISVALLLRNICRRAVKQAA